MSKTVLSPAKINLLRLVLFPYKAIPAVALFWLSMSLMDKIEDIGLHTIFGLILVLFVNCLALVLVVDHLKIYTFKKDRVYRSTGIYFDKSTYSLFQKNYISKFSLDFRKINKARRFSKFNLFDYGKIVIENDIGLEVVEYSPLFVEQINLALWIMNSNCRETISN